MIINYGKETEKTTKAYLKVGLIFKHLDGRAEENHEAL
jgi:hypothetical protein